MVDRDWQDWKVLRAIPTGPSVPSETYDWLLEYAKSKQIPFIFLEREREDGRFTVRHLKALGPTSFAEDVNKAPNLNDTFWGLAEGE